MALSEKTINKHNLKRAEVFAANGLGEHDVALAHPAFTGYSTGDTDCCLCGHKHIHWLFAIKFAAPDATTALGKIATGLLRTEEVTLQYVGSKCITDWLDAVPESKEKLEALARWHVEMEKCKRAMKAKVVDDLCAKAGLGDAQGAYDAFKALPDMGSALYPSTFGKAFKAVAKFKERSRLASNARSIKHRTASRATVKAWLEVLEKALLVVEQLATPKASDIDDAPDAPAQPTLSPEDASLLDEARGIFKAGLDSGWKTEHRATVIDIAKRVKKQGRFTSTKQRDYFVILLKKVAKPVAKPAVASPAAVPGDDTFASASNVAGARY